MSHIMVQSYELALKTQKEKAINITSPHVLPKNE